MDSRMMLRKLVTIALSVLLTIIICSGAGFAQEGGSNVSLPAGSADKGESEDSGQQNARNVNVDMQLAYGQYNNMFSTISLSHESENLAYLLTSNFKRSNDYGYKSKTFFNTSYYENKIGFTGNFTVSDTWRTLFEAAVDSDSHGMYDNQLYNREEKEKYSLLAKSTVRSSSSFEWYSSLGYAGYTHRLSGRDDADNEKSSLGKIRGELGGEYVWSGSNRIRGTVVGAYYDYSADPAHNDGFVKAEIVDDFKITSSTGVSIGNETCWSRDGGMLALADHISSVDLPLPFNPYVAVSYTGSKYMSMSMSYKYDMENFRPENLFFDQRYVFPVFNLPPSRSHVGEGKLDFRIGDSFSLKNSVVVKKTDNFYNFYNYFAGASPDRNGNVLSAHGVDVTDVDAKTDAVISIRDGEFKVTAGYEYQWFLASENITYHPAHQVNIGLKYGSKEWNIEWTNKIASSVYTDVSSHETLPRSIVGLVGVQMQLVGGLFSYLRVENIYNSRYYLREGYPEAGITVLGGLRILI
jgi:hypothetical protein